MEVDRDADQIVRECKSSLERGYIATRRRGKHIDISIGLVYERSGVRNQHERFGTGAHSFIRRYERLGIERAEAFIKYQYIGFRQQRARQKHAASFTFRKLPTGLTNGLIKSRGHAREQRIETEISTHITRIRKIILGRWPGPAEEQVECKRSAENTILMRLRN